MSSIQSYVSEFNDLIMHVERVDEADLINKIILD